MAQPTPSDAHVNAILTNISIAYMQEATNFVAPRVFPIIPVDHQSNLYFKYNKDDWFREEAQKRAPNTESAGSGYELTTDSYYAHVYAVHKDIADQLRANADDVIDLDSDAARWTARQILMKLESVFVASYLAASTWTGTASAADQAGVAGAPGANQFRQWNDVSSTPIEDITRYIDEMQEKTGYKPNTMVVGPRVAAALRNHPDVIDRVKYTQRGIIGLELVAQAMGLDSIVEARATRNTANEGGTDAYSFYFGKKALLLYVNPTPSLLAPSAGYMFAWTGYTGTGGVEGIGTGARTSKLRMDPIKADRVEAELAIDCKVVAADLGVYMDTAVA